ncbi:unannotated protein [freshwater metagenome]|uniref:Unannotated protein n=1 Tax=freshwater metagenome TaxID=449393 RepID=A0A6J7FYM4_9ZZZZ
MTVNVPLTSRSFPTTGRIAEDLQIGRDRTIGLVEGRLWRGDHSLLFGDRRIGKSSIAAAALARLNTRGVLTIDLDLSQGIRDGETLTAELLQAAAGAGVSLTALRAAWAGRRRTVGRAGGGIVAIAEALRSAGVDDVPEGVVERVVELAESTAQPRLEHAFELLHVVRRTKRVVVFIDEAGLMTSWDECLDIADQIARAMRRPAGIVFAFAGSHRRAADELFGPDGSLHAEGLPVTIEPISDTEWEGELLNRFAANDCMITVDIVRQLLTLSDGHPQDTMRLSACCLDHASISGGLIDKAVLTLAHRDASSHPSFGRR